MPRSSSKNGIREYILKDGSKSFEARIKRIGEAELSKRFPNRKAALEWKRSVDTKIDQGVPVLNSKTVLVEKVIKDYLKHRESTTPPLPANQITEYERAILDLGTRAIGSLRRTDLQEWTKLLLTDSRGTFKDGRDKGPYAPASVRKFYYCFKTATIWHSTEYRYKVDEFLFKPPKGTVPAAWDGKRQRRLASTEEKALYESGIERRDTYTKKDWESIIGFALETAMREQEIVFARWKDLRQSGYKLYIPEEHCKTKTSRMVLLSGKARAIVEFQRSSCPKDETRIFYQIPNPDALCKAFGLLTDRAKIADLTFHDLRHEATSRLCEGGKLNMMQIMEMTGHASMASFRGYLHLLAHENSIILD
jgi:integrase